MDYLDYEKVRPTVERYLHSRKFSIVVSKRTGPTGKPFEWVAYRGPLYMTGSSDEVADWNSSNPHRPFVEIARRPCSGHADFYDSLYALYEHLRATMGEVTLEETVPAENRTPAMFRKLADRIARTDADNPAQMKAREDELMELAELVEEALEWAQDKNNPIAEDRAAAQEDAVNDALRALEKKDVAEAARVLRELAAEQTPVRRKGKKAVADGDDERVEE